MMTVSSMLRNIGDRISAELPHLIDKPLEAGYSVWIREKRYGPNGEEIIHEVKGIILYADSSRFEFEKRKSIG